MTSETRTVCFNVDPALNAYLAWIAEAGREFDMGAYDLFAAGYRARTDGDAAQAEVARLRAALESADAMALAIDRALSDDEDPEDRDPVSEMASALCEYRESRAALDGAGEGDGGG